VSRRLRIAGALLIVAISISTELAAQEPYLIGMMKVFKEDGCSPPAKGSRPEGWKAAKGCDFLSVFAQEVRAGGGEVRAVFGSYWELYDWARTSRLDGLIVSAGIDFLLTEFPDSGAAKFEPVLEFEDSPGPGLTPEARNLLGATPTVTLRGEEPQVLGALRDSAQIDCLDARSHLSASSFLIPALQLARAFESAATPGASRWALDEQALQSVDQVLLASNFSPMLRSKADLPGPVSPKCWNVIPWTQSATKRLSLSSPDFDLKRYLDTEHAVPSDRLLVRKDLRDPIEKILEGLVRPATGDYLPRELPLCPQESELERDPRCLGRSRFNSALRRLVDGLPQAHPLKRGFSDGAFSFSLQQVINLLNADQEPKSPDVSQDNADRGQALVLSGGGVKSVFQAVILDHMLPTAERVRDSGGTWAPDQIIGTSGGALTAVVAWLKLSTLIPGPTFSSFWPIRHLEILNFAETLRQGSALLSLAILAVMLMIIRWPFLTRISKLVRTARSPRPSFSILLLTASSMFLVPYLVGHDSQPQRLAEGAVTYVTSLLICYSLVCFVRFVPAETATSSRPLGLILLPAIHVGLLLATCWLGHLAPRPLGLAGLLSGTIACTLVFGALARKQIQNWLFLTCMVATGVGGGYLGILGVHPSLIASVAFLACISTIAWSPYSYLQQRADSFPYAVPLVAILQLLLTAAIFVAYHVPKDAGEVLSELRSGYWMEIAGASALAAAIISFAYLLLVLRTRSALALRLAHSESKALRLGPIKTHPWAVFLTISFVGVIWWNAQVPAALYGGEKLRRYFEVKLKDWFPNGASTVSLDAPSHVQLTLTGSVLTRSKKSCYSGDQVFWRYSSLEDDETGIHDGAASIVGRGRPENILLPRRLASDKSWIIATSLASGAPFPLLPPVQFTTTWSDDPESECRLRALQPGETTMSSSSFLPRILTSRISDKVGSIGVVDGGYSNLLPVSVARDDGATTVVLINSTPRCSAEAIGRAGLELGALPENLGRIFSYLFDRSQEPDRLAVRDLRVIEIRPPEKDFCPAPFLLEFDPTVTDRWKDATLKLVESQRAIASVESWGLPSSRPVPRPAENEAKRQLPGTGSSKPEASTEVALSQAR
jgi:hypothetical protein